MFENVNVYVDLLKFM